nr:hypothetical protein RKHAN_01065 [Rhizobium sp. Khangiran2]
MTSSALSGLPSRRIDSPMTMTGAIMSDRFAARCTAAGATVLAPLSLLSLDLTRGCRVR